MAIYSVNKKQKKHACGNWDLFTDANLTYPVAEGRLFYRKWETKNIMYTRWIFGKILKFRNVNKKEWI